MFDRTACPDAELLTAWPFVSIDALAALAALLDLALKDRTPSAAPLSFDLTCLDSFRRWRRTCRNYRRDECRADRILFGRIMRGPSLAPAQQKLT
ncbi:hypothetical protein J4G48_0049595 (plasmid) [Bradyrhizobium barranii subsp. apii]|uniref:hypothetical protein n=1 Tax=Bradyrhizobium TaxID=374 RepID=UPI001CD582D9|nr:hypothetical protein [Bradyrhizobium barranii]UPU01683.1 hypothetical protein J4G48_0049595 [Bradyrhizobium barranii subsp. apii]